MKKRTDEEKKELIDKACDLFNEAREKIIEGKRLMHLCGIDYCDGIHEDEAREILGECNLQLHRGIKKLEKISGSKGYFPISHSTQKPNRSRINLKYKNLLFMQLGEERTATNKKFTFR